MLKKEITYENFDGEAVTETFYFNLTQSEILEMEVEHEGGLEAAVRRIVAAKNYKDLVAEFKKIVLHSYGVKSEDGRRFIKNDQLREEFSQTAAYDKLFVELATDENAAAEFMAGVIPREMARQIDQEKQQKEANSMLAPPTMSQDRE